jgi:hypothetical protein
MNTEALLQEANELLSTLEKAKELKGKLWNSEEAVRVYVKYSREKHHGDAGYFELDDELLPTWYPSASKVSRYAKDQIVWLISNHGLRVNL